MLGSETFLAIICISCHSFYEREFLQNDSKIQKYLMFEFFRKKRNWHVLCITNLYILFVMQGCYYWRDLDVLESNTDPVILHSDPVENGTMVLNRQTNTAFVVVKDENDPENLRFQWWIGGEGPLGFAEPLPTTEDGFQGSRVNIPRDEKYVF